MRLAGKIIEPVFNESVNLQQNDNLPRPTLNRRPSYGYVSTVIYNPYHVFQEFPETQ